MAWIVVRNWERFQHYSDRDPVWIKNYTRLLSDDAYLDLTWVQRGVLHALWLEYARGGREITDNTARLTRRLGGRVTRETLDALNHAGFIEFRSSASLAERSPREEKRREEKEEENLNRRPSTNSHYPDDAGLQIPNILTRDMPA